MGSGVSLKKGVGAIHQDSAQRVCWSLAPFPDQWAEGGGGGGLSLRPPTEVLLFPLKCPHPTCRLYQVVISESGGIGGVCPQGPVHREGSSTTTELLGTGWPLPFSGLSAGEELEEDAGLSPLVHERFLKV